MKDLLQQIYAFMDFRSREIKVKESKINTSCFPIEFANNLNLLRIANPNLHLSSKGCTLKIHLQFFFQPYVLPFLQEHNLSWSEVQYNLIYGQIKALDVVLMTLSFFLKKGVCLFNPHFIWLSNPINKFSDLEEFGLFFCVSEGRIFNMCKETDMDYRGISNLPMLPYETQSDVEDDDDDDEDLLQWTIYPGTDTGWHMSMLLSEYTQNRHNDIRSKSA